jgi:hypothetical protein
MRLVILVHEVLGHIKPETVNKMVKIVTFCTVSLSSLVDCYQYLK